MGVKNFDFLQAVSDAPCKDCEDYYLNYKETPNCSSIEVHQCLETCARLKKYLNNKSYSER